ncbi:hypothetical protein H5P36_20130 [Bacillus sp. APMAM]|nr:hypothetical protein [Bacillus sp. APMAM]RTZ54098.1 hypothetical protein EKO25_19905 [Bacillus sp. SAJ1]
MRIPEFRRNALYKRSLDLFHEVFRTIEEEGEQLEKIEVVIMRKRVLRITKKVTLAIVQQNIKIKYKSLNEAKGELVNLLEHLYQFCNEGKIEDWNGFIIDYYAEQVMKLL